jgi:hypothetical protein
VGLETLSEGGYDSLPRAKRKTEDHLEALASWCGSAGVELNCFVIVGLPGTTIADAQHTMATVRRLGARARPTVYSPLESMAAQLTEEQITSCNRQLFVPGTHGLSQDELEEAYRTVFGPQEDLTTVFHRVPRHPSAPTPQPSNEEHAVVAVAPATPEELR